MTRWLSTHPEDEVSVECGGTTRQHHCSTERAQPLTDDKQF